MYGPAEVAPWRTSNAMSKIRPAGSLHFKESEHERTSRMEKWRPHDPRGIDTSPELLRRHRRYHGRLQRRGEILHTRWPVARLGGDSEILREVIRGVREAGDVVR